MRIFILSAATLLLANCSGGAINPNVIPTGFLTTSSSGGSTGASNGASSGKSSGANSGASNGASSGANSGASNGFTSGLNSGGNNLLTSSNPGATQGNNVTPTPTPTSTPVPSVDNEGLVKFGGMWGMFYNGSASQYYKNPITGSNTCPPGYTAVKSLGTSNIDYIVQWCMAPLDGNDPQWDFGGLYGYGTDTNHLLVHYNNPATNSLSCPSGYTSVHVAGSPNTDYDMFYCYRAHVHGQHAGIKFGGMSGRGLNANNVVIDFVNPLTNGTVCPGGYTSTRVHGSPSATNWPGDYGMNICWQ